jgi:hypothetical protein
MKKFTKEMGEVAKMRRYARKKNFFVPLKVTKNFPSVIRGVLAKNRKK